MIIYKTTNLVNGKIYVGQSKYNNPRYYGSGKRLALAIDKYGIENFKREIIEECNTQDELNEREKYWIKELNCRDRSIGYNITAGGDGGPGGPNFKGRKHTAETKKKMSEGQKKFWQSEKGKEVLKNRWDVSPLKGKKLSESTKLNLSQKAKERCEKYGGPRTGRGKLVIKYDINDNVIQTFNMIKTACDTLGVSRNQIKKYTKENKQINNFYIEQKGFVNE